MAILLCDPVSTVSLAACLNIPPVHWQRWLPGLLLRRA